MRWEIKQTVCEAHGPVADASRRCPDCDRPLRTVTFAPVEQKGSGMGNIERRLWRIDLNDIRVHVQGEGGRNLEVVQAAGELDGPLTVTVALPQARGAVEAERARIVERIRREASETFDMQLDVEFRQLADLIERGGQ